MNSDFNKDTFEIWVDNYKRPREINQTVRSWLNSVDVDKINVIVNHSSITLNSFSDDLKDKVKLWPNVLRHDDSRGPINKNINQAYIHTFLSGKKYCMVAHDNLIISPGWAEIVKKTDYEFISAPMGDQFHLMSLSGLQKFGWWDERYTQMGHHELCTLTRMLRLALKGGIRASIVDHHSGWPEHFDFVHNNCCYFNDCGLGQYFTRMSKETTPQVGESRSQKLKDQANEWNNIKWRGKSPTDLQNILEGPTQPEINWYSWLDLESLSTNLGHY